MRRLTIRAVATASCLVVQGALALAGEDESAIRKDLAAALAPPCWQPVYAKVPGDPLRGMMPGRPVAKMPWEAPATLEAARTLARRHGEAAIPLWSRIVRDGKGDPEWGLALATLVALADRREGADALVALLFDRKSMASENVAFSLIVDLHGEAARPLLERLVSEACERFRSKPQGPDRYRVGPLLVHAGVLLEAVGDRHTRELFAGLLDQGGDAAPAAHPLRRALDGLEARLALPEAERAAWTRDAIEFWKASRYTASITVQIGVSNAVSSLAHRGVRLGVPFLRHRLAGLPDMVAIAVTARQREAELVPDLARIVERGGGWRLISMALGALGEFGTREALDALLGLVRPDLKVGVAAPLTVLARQGDATTLKALQRLATDPSFGTADQADIVVGRDYLAARLAGKIKGSSMRDGPQFSPR